MTRTPIKLVAMFRERTDEVTKIVDGYLRNQTRFRRRRLTEMVIDITLPAYYI